MEFLKANYLNTTGLLTIDSGTSTAKYLMDRDTKFQWASSGYTGTTTTTITISFSETLTVSRIALLEHNLKSYQLYYNGVTTNTFGLTGGATTVTDFITNSETSQFFRTASQACTSVSLLIREAMTSVERAIGYFVFSTPHHTFSRDPSAKGYQLRLDPKDIVHTLSDGGIRIQNISDKFLLDLSYEYLPASDQSAIKSLWDLHTEFIACPFGTTTGWDGVLFPCVWDGDFDFYNYSDNAPNAGFKGKIKLKETPK